jgi:tRNA G18 (ribose-2'-O)-methylase SpoU
VVRRLLESDFPVESVLLAQPKVAQIAPLAPPDLPVYAAPAEVVNKILGYKFHSGVMACGRRKANPPLASFFAGPADRPVTLVICPEVINTDNLGSLIRISAAFGADAMLLGERSCDAFWRRSIRVSMGTVFRLPIVRCDDLLADIEELRDRWGVELAATVLDADAEPLERAGRSRRFGLLLGSESQGLHPRFVRACPRRVAIPMQLGTDSLNVAVAAAVFLYHFTRMAKA